MDINYLINNRIVFISLIFIIFSSGQTTYAQTYTVERVIDGDTLKLTTGERVRLIGIDTPESKPNDKAKRDAKRTNQDLETITKMGQEAAEFMRAIISDGEEIWLEFDVQKKDKYGRLLAYVFEKGNFIWDENENPNFDEYHEDVVNNENGRSFVNAVMVSSGYATPMTIPPNVKYAELFKSLYKEAREKKRGLWK